MSQWTALLQGSYYLVWWLSCSSSCSRPFTDASRRCGYSWEDANKSCNNLCWDKDNQCSNGMKCYKDLTSSCGAGQGPISGGPVSGGPASSGPVSGGPGPVSGGSFTDASRRCGYSWEDANKSCNNLCWDKDSQCYNGMKCYKDLGNTCAVGQGPVSGGSVSGGPTSGGPVYGGPGQVSGGGSGPAPQPQSGSCNFGDWMCGSDNITLYQCGYVQGNVLSWRQHSQCQNGTRCVVGQPAGFVGCN
ncbi:hypothetical protein BCR33DRAFT_245901 [Rhizoclosmatium globosum]|uniref:CBM1 domain-containing protein n=1 Tax=Rhizoclosmatium globosum TaxID=329046 RepID=A0A1Y2C9Z2_9FUNG|nr:hypothetical protein BCR33DRAFT_245901 [Rhizoclosmatium globosum]|eukprot:ORY43674.1 hypothetical protein BCR33DRAFT_245901 [Rhizoclosmatium globosum]